MDLRHGHVLFFTKFAHLYDSGVPLAEALEIVKAELQEPLHTAVDGVIDDVYRGVCLADAMAGRPECFGPEVVGVIRAGELRGELGDAASRLADGLQGNVLDPAAFPEDDLDELLGYAASEGILHLEPGPEGGCLKVRRDSGLEDAGVPMLTGVAAGLQRRAGVDGENGEGAFFWNERVVRVAWMPTKDGPACVVRVSKDQAEEPADTAAWRAAAPALFVIAAPPRTDKDASLRAILKGFDPEKTKRVAIELPVPEALPAPEMAAALAQDPDVVCIARLREIHDVRAARHALLSGVHVVAGMDLAADAARARLEEWGAAALVHAIHSP